MGNDERGTAIRRTLKAPPPAGPCRICGGLFEEIDAWVERSRQALEGLEFDTLLVTSHEHSEMAERERTIQALVGADLAEPYRQEFNRAVGTRLCEETGAQPDFVHPDIVVLADHAEGTVTLDVRPLFVSGRYRKLVRGLPQCRWAAWPSSVQAVIGDPIRDAAAGEDHSFHGCGREDVDVRCLGERPFVLEILRPRRRRLDWAALERRIGESGAVEVVALARCAAEDVARIKSLRPDKTYRALVRLAEPVADLAPLANLAGRIRQRTPTRALRSRPDRIRHRRVRSVAWKSVDARTVELEVRTEAGLYVKELVSGDAGRTRPSVAAVLGVAAECIELDVIAIHI
jgi:tRNA pseudouridine synthase 10